ncbi:MAG: hypothetical protein ABII07_00825 [Patescibacteria group bacterium]|nr:hypothetical protein [Patescibacteria group bacterium]
MGINEPFDREKAEAENNERLKLIDLAEEIALKLNQNETFELGIQELVGINANLVFSAPEEGYTEVKFVHTAGLTETLGRVKAVRELIFHVLVKAGTIDNLQDFIREIKRELKISPIMEKMTESITRNIIDALLDVEEEITLD